jgi:hypothetical protein
MKPSFIDAFWLLIISFCMTGKAQTNCRSFSTYFGGTQSDEIKSVVTDHNKNTYVAGNTYSTDLPVTPGLINDTHSGSYDGFIAKFDSCGSLLWSTYLGGANFDSAEKIALGTDGNILICGYTSSLNTFTTTGCFQATNNGGYDAFICKINPAGHLVWSTLFGMAGGDFAYDITVDKLNNISVGGTTTSTGLYTVAGTSFQVNLKGNTDAFIARFSPTGALKWCTYYGGNNSEDIHVVTTDANCHVIGAGGSFSTNLNTSAGAHQSLNEGSTDCYVIKLDSNGARVFSSYFGGSGLDDVWGVACDAASNIYLAGHTNSTDFDTTAGAYQTINKGFSDWFLSKWSPTGTLTSCTLFGGSQEERLGRMILSGPHELTLMGKTESNDVSMLGSSIQSTLAGTYDILLAKFDVDTMEPLWSSYYGGAQDEEGFDLVGYDGKFMCFAGSTNSPDFPVSSSPYQSTLNASVDGFLVKLDVGNLVTTGFREQRAISGPVAFPNPFSDIIYVKGAGIVATALYDLQGRNLSELVRSEDPRVLNTSVLAPGIYVLVITDANGSHAFRMSR